MSKPKLTQRISQHIFLASLECSIIWDTYPELQIKLLNVYKSPTFSFYMRLSFLIIIIQKNLKDTLTWKR